MDFNPFLCVVAEEKIQRIEGVRDCGDASITLEVESRMYYRRDNITLPIFYVAAHPIIVYIDVVDYMICNVSCRLAPDGTSTNVV